MPREALVKIEIRGRGSGGIRVGRLEGHLLEKIHGWQLVKKTRDYAYVVDPKGRKLKGTFFEEAFQIPTADEMIASAQSLHESSSGLGGRWTTLFSWPVLYLPQLTIVSQEISLGLKEPGWKAPPPTTSEGPGPMCVFGRTGTWEATVKWGDRGPYIVHESGAREAAPDDADQRTLFDTMYVEGAAQLVIATKYERDAQARRACITHYGATCQICELNFLDKYGEIGRGFIHVHHLDTLASDGTEHVVDPINDLRPVCPNCHVMLHTETPPMPIERLRAIVMAAKTRTSAT